MTVLVIPDPQPCRLEPKTSFAAIRHLLHAATMPVAVYVRRLMRCQLISSVRHPFGESLGFGDRAYLAEPGDDTALVPIPGRGRGSGQRVRCQNSCRACDLGFYPRRSCSFACSISS